MSNYDCRCSNQDGSLENLTWMNKGLIGDSNRNDRVRYYAMRSVEVHCYELLATVVDQYRSHKIGNINWSVYFNSWLIACNIIYSNLSYVDVLPIGLIVLFCHRPPKCYRCRDWHLVITLHGKSRWSLRVLVKQQPLGATARTADLDAVVKFKNAKHAFPHHQTIVAADKRQPFA